MKDSPFLHLIWTINPIKTQGSLGCAVGPLFQVLLICLEEKIQAKNLALQFSIMGHFKTNSEEPVGSGLEEEECHSTQWAWNLSNSTHVWKSERVQRGDVRISLRLSKCPQPIKPHLRWVCYLWIRNSRSWKQPLMPEIVLQSRKDRALWEEI